MDRIFVHCRALVRAMFLSPWPVLYTPSSAQVPGGVLKLVLIRFVDHKRADEYWNAGKNIDAILMNGKGTCVCIQSHCYFLCYIIRLCCRGAGIPAVLYFILY